MESELLSFIDESRTPYHLCQRVSKCLSSKGYTQKDYTDQIIPQKEKIVTIHREKSLYAINNNGTGPVTIFLATTNTPALTYNEGCIHHYEDVLIALEPRGEGKWHTFIDRNLRVAGKITTADGSKLVDSEKGVCVIPSAAIHLDHKARLTPTYELRHLKAMIGTTTIKKAIETLMGEPLLDGVEHDLYFFDSNKPRIFGNFIMSGGLSDLGHTYCAIKSFQTFSQKNPAILALIDTEHLEEEARYLKELLLSMRPHANHDALLSLSHIFSFEPTLTKQPLYPQTWTVRGAVQLGQNVLNLSGTSHHRKHGEKVREVTGIGNFVTFGFPVLAEGSARETAATQDIGQIVTYFEQEAINPQEKELPSTLSY